MDEDRIYYARRAEEQRRAAALARTEVARRRHLELAALLAAGARGERIAAAHP